MQNKANLFCSLLLFKLFKVQGKLHFVTLNHTLCYTLHLKFFKCMFCTINYKSCYTLHPTVKFAINLNENSKFRVQSVKRVQFKLVKYNLSFIFKALTRQVIMYFQVNDKLRGAKCNKNYSLRCKKYIQKVQVIKNNIRYSLR